MSLLTWLQSLFSSKTTVTREVGRNEQCPCGSGQKFKRCCMEKLSRQRREQWISAGTGEVPPNGPSSNPAANAIHRANAYRTPKG
ncbi:MAG: SEC-C metal-binding domain-containing protein [Thermoanaerobaculia bacterium]